MSVDPPDEVSALRNRISELEEEAQSRLRGAPQEEESPATVHASAAAEINQLRVTVQDLQRARFFEIGDGEESCGRRSISSDVHVERPRRFFAERSWIEQVQPIVEIRSSRYGLRAVRAGEASHPGPPPLRLVGTLNELRTFVARQCTWSSQSPWQI